MPIRLPRPGLLPQAQDLYAALTGQMPGRVPRQELFFGNRAIAHHFVGRDAEGPGDFRHALELARNIGWGMARGTSWGVMIGSRSETASDGTAHYAGGSPITWEDLDRLREPDLAALAEQFAANAEAIRAEGLLVHIFMLHCFHSAATGIGMERLCLMVYDQPELLREYMCRIEAFNRRGLRAILDTGLKPDIAIFDADCAFKTACMVSPRAYRDLIAEPTAATCEVLREAGITIMMHTDGHIDDVYPVWLEMGLAGAHGVEAQANDLGHVKARFGGRMALFGNFDPVILATDEPERVRQMAREMVEVGKPGGRYVAAVNTIVGEEVPLENYLAFIEGADEAASY